MAEGLSDLRIKRIYEPPADDDSARVLVDRIWPRGVSKQKAALTLWLKEIAPSTELREWFGHDPAKWVEFRERYWAELADNQPAVTRLTDLLRLGRVTLLYGAHDTAHNQAVALADYVRDHLEQHHGRHPA